MTRTKHRQQNQQTRRKLSARYYSGAAPKMNLRTIFFSSLRLFVRNGDSIFRSFTYRKPGI